VLTRLLTALRHPIGRTVIALYWVQFATFVAPLITLPYVARVLQPSQFGVVVFAQGFAFVLVVFIDWGLGLTGIRSTAAHRDDPDALADVVRGVRGGQLVLAAISAVFAVAALVLVPTMRAHPGFLVMAWVAAVTLAASPNWFFLGIEQARVTAMVQLGFRAVAAALTFVLVKGPGDAWIVMALFTGSSVGGLIVSDVMMYRRVAFRVPAWRPSLREIRDGTMIFVGMLASALATGFSVVILGIFASSADVAHFGAAERLVRVVITLLAPIGGAVIPRLTALQAGGDRERARRLLTIAVLIAALPALGIMLVLIVFASPILHVIYGERFVDASVPILRVLALFIPVNVIGAVFALWLMTLHRDRLMVTIALAAGVASLVFGCASAVVFGPLGLAWSVVASQAIGAACGFIVVRRDARRAAAEAPIADPGAQRRAAASQ
jgi:polysaccharide transporter, PST family